MDLTKYYMEAGNVWAGDLPSLHAFAKALKKIEELQSTPEAKTQAMTKSAQGVSFDEEDYLPELLKIQGDTAIINIQGTLVAQDSWFNQFVGLVSYQAIRRAAMYAATSEDINRVLMMIDCSGGQVTGMTDTSDLLGKIAKMKPLLAHTTGNLGSAAYYLAVNAQHISAGPMTEVGSIGAVIRHTEYTEAMQKAGVKSTIVRSGPYKYAGNEFEELTPETLATLQEHVNYMDNLFVKHVATKRGKTESYVQTHQGQGRTFIGEVAKDVGLVDAVYGYDDMMTKVMAGDFDNIGKSTVKSYLGETSMDAATILALAEQGIAIDPNLVAQAKATVASAASGGNQEVPKTEPTKQPEQPEKPTQPTEATGTEVDTQANTGISILNTQLQAKDETILTLRMEKREQEKELESLRQANSAMHSIVAQSAKNTAVALGLTGADYNKMSSASLLEQHEQLTTQFTSKFKAGGVTASVAQTFAAGGEVEQLAQSKQQDAALRATKLA